MCQKNEIEITLQEGSKQGEKLLVPGKWIARISSRHDTFKLSEAYFLIFLFGESSPKLQRTHILNIQAPNWILKNAGKFIILKKIHNNLFNCNFNYSLEYIN